MGQVRPRRLLPRLDLEKLGAAHKIGEPVVQKCEPIGLHQVVALRTSTRTFVCEGLASHNCVPSGQHDDLAMALALAVKKLPWRRGQLRAPIGVPKAGGSLWVDGASTVRAEPSLTGDPRGQQPPPDEVPAGTPFPILVRGPGYGGGSKWRGADQ